jgi:spore protease
MTKINLYRTDLLEESEQIASLKPDESGVVVENSEHQRVQIKKVRVDETGAQKINKKFGDYITLTIPQLHVDDIDGLEQMQEVLVQELEILHEGIKLNGDSKILVIGLGNKTITPDAVGPVAIDVLQTVGVSQFITYAPGVTGQSGLETKDFIDALVKKINPDLVIVIDALATKSTQRLCKTIQLTNTGIHPGSGVGNTREEIAYETLGVPVTAIGVPTVVDAVVLLNDAVNMLFRTIAAKIDEREKPSSKLSIVNWSVPETYDASTIRPIFGEWTSWSHEERHQLLEEVLSVQQRLIVSPKEIDLWNNCYSELISSSLADWMKNLQQSS